MNKGQIRVLRNLRDANGDAIVFAGEIRRDFRNDGVEALLQDRSEVIVLPPRVNNVVVRENLALAGDKSSAKEIRADFGSLAFGGVDGFAFAVLERLAIGGDAAVAQSATGTLFVEGNRN